MLFLASSSTWMLTLLKVAHEIPVQLEMLFILRGVSGSSKKHFLSQVWPFKFLMDVGASNSSESDIIES